MLGTELRARRLLGWLAFMLAGASVLAQGDGLLSSASPIPSRREFHLKHWNSEDGLPQNFVRVMLQTRDGYLWMGTQFGLARFDGIRFTTFDRYNTPEMGHDTISSLAEDGAGNLWIGTDAGPLKYVAGRFVPVDTGRGQPGDVRLLFSPQTDTMWAIYDSHIFRLRAGRWDAVPFTGPGRLRYYRIAIDPASGEALMATGKALYRFSEVSGTFELATPPGGPPSLLSIHPSKSSPGTPFAFSESALYSFENGRWTEYPTARRIRESYVLDILRDRSGSVWFACRDLGLLRLHEGRISQFDLGPDASACEVHSLIEDREGNIWVGTECGLVRLTPVQVRTYTVRDRLDNNKVWSVSEGRDGGVWASTQTGFNLIRDGEVRPFKIDGVGALSSPVLSIVEDQSHVVWLGRLTTRGLPRFPVVRFKDDRFQGFDLVSARTNGGCRAIYIDRSNRVWIASNDGVICWGDRLIASYPVTEDPAYGTVRAIHVARDGSLWFGTYTGGLRHIRDGKVTVYDSHHQLASNLAWALHEDTNGVIWAGTEHGLVRIEKGRVTLLNRKHGLGESVINQILEDDNGNLWLSGLRGIYRVRRDALDAIASGRTNYCHVLGIGESEGMENAETNGENQPAGCKTRDGLLWFPTIKGVVVIDPKKFCDNSLVPPVVIEKVMVDDEPVTSVTTEHAGTNDPPILRLKPGRARVLEVYYTANSLISPERLRFKYRLEGYESDWRDAGDRRVAFYTNLRPGDYHFQVIACNNHGYWNNVGAGFRFTLAPHLYETWWFYGLCGLALAGAAALVLGVRLRIQRKFLRLEQQAELERMRARIAEDMHDDVGASLSQIAILSEVARRDLPDARAAESSVERISSIARRLVDSLSELVWATNPRNDTLGNMAAYFREYAASYFEPTSIRCRLDFPTDVPVVTVPPETRRALLLVLKEALHNVVKHSAASEVEVSLRMWTPTEPRRNKLRSLCGNLEMSVTDNGRGLPVAEGSGFGNGLRNMRRRIEGAGGEFDLQRLPGGGLRVRAVVPLWSETG